MSRLFNLSIIVTFVLMGFIIVFKLCFLLGYAYIFFEHNDLFLTIGPSLSDLDEQCTLDVLNFFSEGSGQNYPDNFMELSSSSDNDPTEDNNNNNSDNHDLIDYHASASTSTTTTASDQPLNEKVEKDIESNRKLNPSTGGSQSSNIPQTEFERKPYLENAPLPKSQSDPTSLGQNRK